MTDMSLDRRTFVKLGAGMVSAVALVPEASALAAPFRSETPLSVALIGAGRQGRLLLGELKKFDFVKVDALCDVDEGRLRSGGRRAPGAATYADFRALLDKEKGVQAVFLATPTHLHAEIAEAVLASGRHLYCEAPLANTVEDAKRIARAASSAKGLCHVGLQLRANPIYKLARSFLLSGAIRDVVSLRGQYHMKTSGRVASRDPSKERFFNWMLYKESSIGLPGEKGIHSFDAMNWFTKKRPEAVEGWGGIMLYDDGREIPDTVNLVFTYPDGVRLLYDATWANSFDGQYELYIGSMGAIKTIGTLGWMFKEADAPTQGWEVYAVREHFHTEEGITLIADATKLAQEGKLKEGVGLPHPPLFYGIQDFLEAVVKGKTKTSCPARVGLEATVIAVKAHEAVMAGKAVTFEKEWFEI